MTSDPVDKALHAIGTHEAVETAEEIEDGDVKIRVVFDGSLDDSEDGFGILEDRLDAADVDAMPFNATLSYRKRACYAVIFPNSGKDS